MVREAPKPADLFDYQDYRAYLSDWFNNSKKSNRAMSFRYFAKKADLQSPNYLKLVMEVKRNLALEGISKFVQGLALNKMESQYFKHMVLYNQSINPDDALAHFQQMTRCQKFSRVRPLEKDQFDLYSEWYHPIIRELITAKGFDGTPQWLVKKINPKVSLSQVEKSLELQVRLGFLKKENNTYKQCDAYVTTGGEAMSLILLKYHQQLLRLCADQLPEIDQELRDISTLSIGIDRSRIKELKEKVKLFREDIIKSFTTDQPIDEVYLLNMQLIPVTE